MTQNDLLFHKTILDNFYEGVYAVDLERRIMYWNKGAERISGYSKQDVLGLCCPDSNLNHESLDGCPLCKGNCPMQKTMDDGITRDSTIFMNHADGRKIPIQVQTTPLKNAEGEIVGAIEVFTDKSALTAAREKIRQLEHIASIDYLTQIGNRLSIEISLRTVLDDIESGFINYSVIYMDIDRFKTINDTFGHLVGDTVLKTTAKTLQSCLRERDALARWGGDEFMIILPNINLTQVEKIANRLRTAVNTACNQIEDLNGHQVTISGGASIICPGDTSKNVTERVDQLLYQAKQSGRNKIIVAP